MVPASAPSTTPAIPINASTKRTPQLVTSPVAALPHPFTTVELVEAVEVAVDGGAGDAELGGDLGDGELSGLIHFPGQPGLPHPELGFLSAGAAPCPGGSQPVHRAFGHEGMFEL